MSQRHTLNVTFDGSHTVYDTKLGAYHHSLNGAVQESRHVFIEAGLSYFHSLHLDLHLHKKPLSILEIGFGAGLNAMMAWQYAKLWQLPIQYESIESDPLPEALYRELNYAAWSPGIRFTSLHEATWGKLEKIDDYFFLKKHHKTWPSYKPRRRFCVIFYDPFSPQHQSLLWDRKAIETAHRLLYTGGILVTYSVQGAFRRMAQDTGFKVELLKGASGKRHMLRATRNSS